MKMIKLAIDLTWDEVQKELGTTITRENRKEVQKLYRALARKHHPDMGGDEEKFKRLAAAWEKAEEYFKTGRKPIPKWNPAGAAREKQQRQREYDAGRKAREEQQRKWEEESAQRKREYEERKKEYARRRQEREEQKRKWEEEKRQRAQAREERDRKWREDAQRRREQANRQEQADRQYAESSKKRWQDNEKEPEPIKRPTPIDKKVLIENTAHIGGALVALPTSVMLASKKGKKKGDYMSRGFGFGSLGGAVAGGLVGSMGTKSSRHSALNARSVLRGVTVGYGLGGAAGAYGGNRRYHAQKKSRRR